MYGKNCGTSPELIAIIESLADDPIIIDPCPIRALLIANFGPAIAILDLKMLAGHMRIIGKGTLRGCRTAECDALSWPYNQDGIA